MHPKWHFILGRDAVPKSSGVWLGWYVFSLLPIRYVFFLALTEPGMTFSTMAYRLHLDAWNVLPFRRAKTNRHCCWESQRKGLYTVLDRSANERPTKLQYYLITIASKQGKGVTGVKSGDQMLKIFPRALSVLQAIHAGNYPGPMRLATASTADTPQCVKIAKAAMALLEIVPGTLCRLLCALRAIIWIMVIPMTNIASPKSYEDTTCLG